MKWYHHPAMAPRFVIEHRGRVYGIEGDVTIAVGRGESCEVRIEDDARVSRHHATFSFVDGAPLVEDRRSRNGVLVNGAPIQDKARLRDGDRVTIGVQVFTVRDQEAHRTPNPVQLARIAKRARQRLTPASMPDEPTTERVESAPALLIAVANEALGADRIDDAKHAGSSLVEAIAGGLALGMVADDRLYASMSRLLIRLAQRTSDPEWLDELFDLHRVASRVVDADAVFALSSVDAGIRARSVDAANGYLTAMAERRVGPDALRLRRLEQLFEGIKRD
jgi:hypothetical protein